MCFSAEADLVIGAAITVVGVDAVRHAKRPTQWPLAALPLVFGAHQITETVVWWGLDGRLDDTVARVAAWAYLVVAFLFPVLVPIAAARIEVEAIRRRIMWGLTALGAGVSAALLVGLAIGGPSFRAEDWHVAYSIDVPGGVALTVLYVVATCGAFLASSDRRIALVGALNLAAVALLAWLLASGFISLWCAWAAILSLLITAYLRSEAIEPHPLRTTILIGLATVMVVIVAVIVIRWVTGTARPVDVDQAARPTGSTLPAEQAVLRPAQGVYRYQGSGTDSLDKPPRSQAQGPEMPASVTHRSDGCWTFRIDYSTNHWQTWDYCPRDGGMVEAGGTSFQRWDFGAFANETTATFTCSDSVTIRADQRPGDEWTQRCTGTATGTEGTTVSEGPYRFIGPDTLTIGAEQEPALRYHRERTTSGNQTGTERSDVWFSARTGLPLRNERHLEAHTETVIGAVGYTEDGSFELVSLDPVR